jgi:hypothetical protein
VGILDLLTHLKNAVKDSFFQMGPIGSISRRGAHSGVLHSLKEHRIRVDWPRVCHSGICGVPSERLHYRIAIPGVSPRAGIGAPLGRWDDPSFPIPVFHSPRLYNVNKYGHR